MPYSTCLRHINNDALKPKKPPAQSVVGVVHGVAMPDVSFIIDYSVEGLAGYGRVYQGAGPDIGLFEFNDVRKRMLVQMAADIGSLQCKDITSLIFMGIDDGPSGVLPDVTLIALVKFIEAWLRDTGDVVLGCVGGISRSSYINIAIMMRITGWPFGICLARIRSNRPQANPMACFIDQLVRLHPALTSQ